VSATRTVPLARITYTREAPFMGERELAVEAPVALEYNGIAYAVMMATPQDLEDFAVGFTLSERLADNPGEVISVHLAEVAGGHLLRIELAPEKADIIRERVRLRLVEGSCGLCGLESIEQVLRPLAPVETALKVQREAIGKALAALENHQPLGRATGAMHAAAFCAPDGTILAAMEDVGRHNALDKLVGQLALQGIDPASGFMLLTARCSYELVEKAAIAGCPMLVTISAPSDLAVERAAAAGLTLVSLARADSALVLTDRLGRIA
jgi:FdhD protein